MSSEVTARTPSEDPVNINLAIMWMLLGVFAVGTVEYLVAGVLPQISHDMTVTEATAGLLVTVYALTVVIGGPLWTIATSRVKRIPLVLALMTLFIAGNLLTALAPSFPLLVIARAMTALPHATFFALCLVLATTLVGPSHQSGSTLGDSHRESVRMAFLLSRCRYLSDNRHGCLSSDHSLCSGARRRRDHRRGEGLWAGRGSESTRLDHAQSIRPIRVVHIHYTISRAACRPRAQRHHSHSVRFWRGINRWEHAWWALRGSSTLLWARSPLRSLSFFCSAIMHGSPQCGCSSWEPQVSRLFHR